MAQSKAKARLDDHTKDLFEDMGEDVDESYDESFSDEDKTELEEADTNTEEESEEEWSPSNEQDAGEHEDAEDVAPAEDSPPTGGEQAASDDDDDEAHQGDESDESDAVTPDAAKDGLLRDLIKQRKDNAELQAQINAFQAQQQQPAPQNVGPAPVAPAPGNTTAPETNIPVMISPDGTEVFVDPAHIDRRVESMVEQRVQQAMQPSPQQLAHQATTVAQTEFVNRVPEQAEVRTAVIERANTADQFLAMRFKELIQQGHAINSPGQGVAVMRQLGLDAEVKQHFPEIEPMLEGFADAMGSGNPSFKSMMLEQLVPAIDVQQGDLEDTVVPRNAPPKSAGKSPRSMSRVGGNRSQPPSADKAEYSELQSNFSKDPLSFPRKSFNRMKALGRKLGVDAYSQDEDSEAG